MSEPPQAVPTGEVAGPPVPDWAHAPLSACLEYLMDEATVFRATMDSLGYTSSIYEATVKIRDLSTSAGIEWTMDDEQMESHRRASETAKTILTDKQHMIAAHTLIGFWAAAEVLVEDLAVAFLAHDPTLLLSERIADVKVPFRDFEVLGKEDRIRSVLPLLQLRHPRDEAPLEAQLELVGLGGPIPAPTRTALREAWQLRNVILHRRGIADARLVKLCPQLKYQVGDKVQIGPDFRYIEAIIKYVDLVRDRLQAKFSVLPLPAADESK